MYKKKQPDNPDQENDGTANVPIRPVQLHGSKRQSTAHGRNARRKSGNASDGIHERCNKRMNW